MNFTNKKEVITYLYALPKVHPKGDLSYIKRVLSELDNPQDKVKTIHITGTNGKGSTSYYVSSLLRKAGCKTGLFVSPYVFEFGERIQINGHNLDNAILVKLANQVKKVIDQIKHENKNFGLITFEFEVVMAFIYFASQNCDYAVIEVGIGGEHDSTNVIKPEISVITTVGMDHERIIGPTLLDIAREKSGIIKYQKPVVLGNVPEAVKPLIEKKARDNLSTTYTLGKDFNVFQGSETIYRDHEIELSFKWYPEVECYDIAVAIKTFMLLNLTLTEQEIEEAITQTQIPGRYQVLRRQPLVILDGAHNVQAMKNLLNFVHYKKRLQGSRLRILIAMMKDKDISDVFSLFANDDLVTLTTLDYERTAKKVDFPKFIQNRYPYNSNWLAAYKKLRDQSEKDDILLITGSFYLVSEILRINEVK